MNLAQAFAANTDAMDSVLVGAMPDVEAAIRQTERELLSFLVELPEDADTWTAFQQRSLLLQLKRLTERSRARTGTALTTDMHRGAALAGKESLASLARIVRAAEIEFGNVQPLRLDIAAVIGSSERTLLHRMGSIATRYGEEVGGRIRRELMVGILRGESVDRMAARLLHGSGMIRQLSERGPKALAEGAAEFVGVRTRAGAERIVRTELVNAYNEVQLDGVKAADRDDPGYLKRWDAAHDRRLCDGCRELDLQTVGLSETFRSTYYGRVERSPAHSCCRCATVPWRRGWSL